jgi:hypothetical protein
MSSLTTPFQINSQRMRSARSRESIRADSRRATFAACDPRGATQEWRKHVDLWEIPLMVILPAGYSAARSSVPLRFTYLAKKGSRSRGILPIAAARTRGFIVFDGKI